MKAFKADIKVFMGIIITFLLNIKTIIMLIS